MIGELNAKVGIGERREPCTSSYGIGTRNSRGDILVGLAELHKLDYENFFFKKRPNRGWICISPNGATKNEINCIMTNWPDSCFDVSVLNSLNSSSHHHLIRVKAKNK